MNSLKHGIQYRVLWAIFALMLSSLEAQTFIKGGSLGSASIAVGWALWAIAWFMQPVIVTTKLSNLMSKSAEYAVGSAGVRGAATFGGLLCIGLGLACKFSSGA